MGRKKRTSVCQRKKYHYKKRKFTKEDDNCLVKNGPLVEHGYSVPHELKIVEESEKCDPQGGWEYQCSAPSEMIKHETDNCDAQVDWENKNNAPGELEETIKCEPQVVDWEYNVQHELEETMKCEPHVDWYALTTTDFQTNDEPTHTDHELKHVQLSEPTIEIETALAPLQILYNNLQACEFLKMYYLLDFNDDAINIIEMYRSSPERTGVKLSIVIDTEFHANLFVHRKEVSKSHPCWDGMPSEFSTAMLVENLMGRLRTFSVCFGNPDEEFHSIAPVKLSLLIGAPLTPGARDLNKQIYSTCGCIHISFIFSGSVDLEKKIEKITDGQTDRCCKNVIRKAHLSRFTESHREVATESSSDDIRMLQQELSSLRQEVEQLRQEVRQNPKTGSDRAFRRDETQNRILLSQERNRRLLLNSQKVTTEIAFYANRPIDYQNISVHQTLAFGNVISNVGNCYHGTSGIFTPSVSGVYVFHVQLIMCSVGHDVRTELVVEGVSKGGHYAGGSTTCANGGGSTIVHVNAGDAVWVRETTSDGKNLFGWETSFSGFLLYGD